MGTDGQAAAGMGLITLTTDFGSRDNYVGVMKGVILGINPQARIVDLTHDLPPHDVAQAAFSLLAALDYFPSGAVHLAVVDPGVGTDRAILAVRASVGTFIAPDNGLLSFVIETRPEAEIRRLENPAWRRPAPSRTFHGRDIMAPAAARLSLNAPFEDAGPLASEILRLPGLAPRVENGEIRGRVIYVDRFGNLITNVPNRLIEGRDAERLKIAAGPVLIQGLSSSYASAPEGEYLAAAGSHGFLEIARNRGRAEKAPELILGASVTVSLD